MPPASGGALGGGLVVSVEGGGDLDDSIEKLSDDFLSVRFEGGGDLGEILVGVLVDLVLGLGAVARVLQGRG